MTNGFVQGGPAVLLRLEGAVLLLAAVTVYGELAHSWWWFAGLLLLPDVSMLGYVANPKFGAVVYNAAHTTFAPALLADGGLVLGHPFAFALAAIWFAHIGLDRMLGYGLKYATGFAHTHLGRVGRAERASLA